MSSSAREGIAFITRVSADIDGIDDTCDDDDDDDDDAGACVNDDAAETLRASLNDGGFQILSRVFLDLMQIDIEDHPALAEAMNEAAREESRLRKLY